jgi:hypothetical protein
MIAPDVVMVLTAFTYAQVVSMKQVQVPSLDHRTDDFPQHGLFG